uniref:Uncharacterized protein n=1 Tax=Mola mola TaxID=94237 RepID=A0A3Q3WR20_MOLML
FSLKVSPCSNIFRTLLKRQVRLVFLGAAGVGKKALIRRFLQDNFSPNDGAQWKKLISLYRSWTLHKLSIHNSDAFALDVKTLRNEILEIQEDKYTPNVVVGNKVDREEERHVSNKDVWSTVEMDWNKGYLEALAKENMLGIRFRPIIIGKLRIHWLHIQCIALCSYRAVVLLNRRSKALVPCHDDLTLGMVKLSTLKVKLHAYTYTQTHTLKKIVQRGVKPVTLSEIKNTERVLSLFSRIDKKEQNWTGG